MSKTLSKDLRNQLARVTLAARQRADQAVRAALQNLAVHEKEYRAHMGVPERELRNRLRARGRALGDSRDERSGAQRLDHLAEQAAYEHWHRILFTRFLVENGLLYTDEAFGSVPVTLKDCEELAPDAGARDGFDLACRFASRILPGVFRQDDPVLELRLAPNDESDLRSLLSSLPRDVFLASDALGWTYQFWQAERKDEVNASGDKIGADELPAVTQLFTEDYMVDFLLDNTLGAWHAGKVLAANPKLAEGAQSEDELRRAVGLPGCSWQYLRFVKGADGKWTPAAGVFAGWPKSAAELKCLDPSMGSGHFVVAMFERLVGLRVAEEELSVATAAVAVVRENLFGLEIDPRCTQIGAFNLALAAWRRAGYCGLPPMNLACSGLAPNSREADWLAIAGGDAKLTNGMARLYRLFRHAPVLGSLINPRAASGDLLEAAFQELQPLLEKVLAQEAKNDTAREMAVTARGIAKAAEILAGKFTLVATNVPYLARGKQDEILRDYCEAAHPEAKPDLATCFIERSLNFCSERGTTALVTPQNWLFLGTYTKLRQRLLRETVWNSAARLGSGAFETIGGEIVNVVLIVNSLGAPGNADKFLAIDASELATPDGKAAALRSVEAVQQGQAGQFKNPDSRIAFKEQKPFPLLETYADCFQGISPADFARYGRMFWEIHLSPEWRLWQSTVEATVEFGGRIRALWWGRDLMDAVESGSAYIRGEASWGKLGIAVSAMGNLPCTLSLGEASDTNAAIVIPKAQKYRAAIWCFCASNEYNEAVRSIDQGLKVTNATLVKVPFDLARWQKVAAERYPKGLPRPFSSDPTQWLFSGHPEGSDHPLHVAVARLLGHHWPRQTGSSFPDCPALGKDGLEKLADSDGIVCLAPLNREQPGASRLREVLGKALGECDERTLIAGTGSSKGSLEDWLRDDFFEQHCDLFNQRPFIWHIWDGRKDGFHALVNYHKLDHEALQKLTYSYLGDWVRQQSEDMKAEKPGAAERLGAAQELQEELANILKGDAPYDIFVRWKPVSKQAKGWHPDVNDGVRLNIRPFMMAADVGKKGAGVLRSKPNIKWDKDRGKEPVRDKHEFPWFWCEEEPDTDPKPEKEFQGHRWNDVHLTLAMKRAAKGK